MPQRIRGHGYGRLLCNFFPLVHQLRRHRLESCPGFSAQPVDPESFCPISEDDFELLAEALTEVTELIEEVILADEEFDEEEDE